jgi:hypothetical protein
MRIYSLYCKEKKDSLDIGRDKEMLDMRQKKAITEELKTRYSKATKKVKSKMLDEFCATTGYNRCSNCFI